MSTSDGLGGHLAGISGDALLELINTIHGLQVDQVATAYGITGADLDRLRSAADKDAMIQAAEEIKADREYAQFFPSGEPAAEDDDLYRSFFPDGR